MNNLNFSYWFKLSDLESVVVDSQGRVSGMTMNRSGAFEKLVWPSTRLFTQVRTDSKNWSYYVQRLTFSILKENPDPDFVDAFLTFCDVAFIHFYGNGLTLVHGIDIDTKIPGRFVAPMFKTMRTEIVGTTPKKINFGAECWSDKIAPITILKSKDIERI